VVTAELTETFDNQLATLIAKDYPDIAGRSKSTFRALVERLRDRVADLPPTEGDGVLPFVVVVGRALVDPVQMVGALEWNGRPGFSDMDPDDLARFVPIVDLPSSATYLLSGVETGSEFQGVRPDDALPVILARGRSPLTLEEGLAVVTHYPGILREQTCFEMLGSRCGDKRVTGLWVSAKRPRLGWCWGGNPHTWLGMASCAGRLGE
jgi:hypothetical protein